MYLAHQAIRPRSIGKRDKGGFRGEIEILSSGFSYEISR